jgi:hypothetical protein
MFPPPEKTFLKHQKITTIFFAHASEHSMCMRQISQKADIFCVLCKKTKISHATPALVTKKLSFYTQHKMSQLCENIEC